MATRTEILNSIYSHYDEETRLTKSRAGELEFVTTMEYIHRHLFEGAKILETGAGTGQYSVRLAKEGYDVTAVELVEKNLEKLKKNAVYLNNIQALQGDATDLSLFGDKTFDVTLSLGPMYHLYEPEEVQKAIDEAIRVTKPGGVIMLAFLSVHAMMMNDYMKNNFEAGYKLNFDDENKVIHFKEQRFTGYNVQDFENLFIDKNVEHLTTVATDGSLQLAEKGKDFKLTDHHFKQFVKYHLANCEQRELLGSSSHLLYICRKK